MDSSFEPSQPRGPTKNISLLGFTLWLPYLLSFVFYILSFDIVCFLILWIR